LIVVGVIAGLAISRSGSFWMLNDEVSSPVPNTDFHMMAIATRPVDALTPAGSDKVRVKAWERCGLGVTWCDKHPRTVEASCLGSGRIVLIRESDWSAFQRIPIEDLPGIQGIPLTMDLCRQITSE